MNMDIVGPLNAFPFVPLMGGPALGLTVGGEQLQRLALKIVGLSLPLKRHYICGKKHNASVPFQKSSPTKTSALKEYKLGEHNVQHNCLFSDVSLAIKSTHGGALNIKHRCMLFD